MRLGVMLLLWCSLLSGGDISSTSHSDPEHPRFSAPEKVSIQTNQVLLVTHACQEWDRRCTVKDANDTLIRDAKQRGIPVVYLQHNWDERAYYCEDKNPDFAVYSSGGEFKFDVTKPTKIVSTGGFSSQCQRRTIREIVSQWEGKREQLEILQVAPAIYEDLNYKKYNSIFTEEQKAKLQKKFGSRRVPLSEVLDLFPTDERRIEYLTTRVQEYLDDVAGVSHRVQIKYRGRTLTIREGKQDMPFTLLFHFDHPNN